MIHRRFGVGGGLSDRVEGLSSFFGGCICGGGVNLNYYCVSAGIVIPYDVSFFLLFFPSFLLFFPFSFSFPLPFPSRRNLFFFSFLPF